MNTANGPSVIYRIIVAFALIVSSFGAAAEIIPATSGTGYRWNGSNGQTGVASTPLAACALLNSNSSGPGFPYYNLTQGAKDSYNGYYCGGTSNWWGAPTTNAAWGGPVYPEGNYTCPAGQNWTLSGANCTRPDCVSPDVRDPATGICGAPPCTAGQAASVQGWANAWAICDKANINCLTGAKTYPSTYCDGSCTVTVASANGCYPQGTPSVDSPAPIYCTLVGALSGSSCTGNNLPTPGTPPVVPKTPAPCATGEGVMTTSTGKVVCVPPGTPGADNPPKVTKQSSTKNFPDGSTQVTTTTQTCTGEGACSSTTTITNTGPSSSPGTTGDAGKPGTSTEVKEKQPAETSSFCQQNPGLQMCKGGMNEEVTQKRVADALTVDDRNYSDITNADQNAAAAQSKQNAIDATTGAITDMSKFGTSADPAAVYHSQVENALTNWFDPIPVSGCQPVGGTIGNRTFSIDICPTAAKISEIGAYAMWVMFAFGILVMVTRKAE